MAQARPWQMPAPGQKPGVTLASGPSDWRRSPLVSADYTFSFRLAFRGRAADVRGMSQSTLDDDELFGEAASEVRSDVESSLAAARDALPEPDAVWDVEADNTLGALNALRSALDVEGAADHLREAKKWYTMGERADAFEDADDLAADIEDLEALLADLEAAREQVGDLTGTVPRVKGDLEDVASAGAAVDAEDDAEAGAESDAAGAQA